MIPSQVFTIRDPGVGRSGSALRRLALAGVAASGSLTEALTTNNPDEVVAEFTRGTLVDDALATIAAKAGPVTLVRVTGDAAGAASAVVQVGTGGAATVDETDASFYVRAAVLVVVTLAGALGTGRVKYSLDAWADNPAPTFSDEFVIPVGGVLPIADLGLTVTFAATVVLGTTYAFSVQPDYYATSVVPTVRDILSPLETWDDLILTGQALTAAGAASMAVAASAARDTLSGRFVFVRAAVGASEATASGVPAAFASVSARFVSAGYGYAGMVNPRTQQGRGFYEVPQQVVAGIISALSLISTDLARVASGSLESIRWITYDAQESGDALDVGRISTFRTWPRVQGLFVTNQRMLSSNVSDFRYWQHAGVMCVAETEVYLGQVVYMSSGQRTEEDAIVGEDKKSIEETILGRLKAALIDPKNAEGTNGHVSDLDYVLDAPHLLTTESAETDTVLVALGYLKQLRSTFGFAKSV